MKATSRRLNLTDDDDDDDELYSIYGTRVSCFHPPRGGKRDESEFSAASFDAQNLENSSFFFVNR